MTLGSGDDKLIRGAQSLKDTHFSKGIIAGNLKQFIVFVIRFDWENIILTECAWLPFWYKVACRNTLESTLLHVLLMHVF